MKNHVKITQEQIKEMYEYLKGITSKNSSKRELKMFYNPLTPKDIYVRYSSVSLLSDNSINSEVILKRIKPDGSKEDCLKQLDSLKQVLEFESHLMEIDLDANRNIVFV